jgi:hypothetical protein
LAAGLHQSRNRAHDRLNALEAQLALRPGDGRRAKLNDHPARGPEQSFPLGFHFLIFSHSKTLVQCGQHPRATQL